MLLSGLPLHCGALRSGETVTQGALLFLETGYAQEPSCFSAVFSSCAVACAIVSECLRRRPRTSCYSSLEASELGHDDKPYANSSTGRDSSFNVAVSFRSHLLQRLPAAGSHLFQSRTCSRPTPATGPHLPQGRTSHRGTDTPASYLPQGHHEKRDSVAHF